MKVLRNITQKVKSKLYQMPLFATAVFTVSRMMMATVYAEEAAKTAFTAVGNVLRIVLSAIGAIFILIGVVRYAIAHSQEDSPSQQKAAMMIGAGIALVVLGNVAPQLTETFTSLVPTGFEQ